MKKYFLLLVIALQLLSCKSVNYNQNTATNSNFQSAQFDTLFQDKISIRAIEIDKNNVWYAADNSKYGYYDLAKMEKFEKTVSKENSVTEFRSIAQTQKDIFLLNVSNPAKLFKVPKTGLENKLVYQENNEKVFFDSLKFWNNQEGIAIGDPINDCFNIIITRDGGNTWKKIACENLPKLSEGEAAFAASNTNIVIKEDNTWVVSGGKKARLFFSPDKGKSWKVFDTPIVQGQNMTGIFSADFYDSKIGFIAGGNYENLNQNFGNKAATVDGGKTWQLVAENQFFGYTSCVQYVPGSGGKELVTVGASGLYYSSDSGNTWKQFSTDASLYTIRFMNHNTAIAAGRNKMIRITFK